MEVEENYTEANSQLNEVNPNIDPELGIIFSMSNGDRTEQSNIDPSLTIETGEGPAGKRRRLDKENDDTSGERGLVDSTNGGEEDQI